MRVIFRGIALIAPAAGLFFLSINYSQPAVAAVSCLSGTPVYYQNNSLAGCVLSSNTEVQVNTNHFLCGERQPINFDHKGQFADCVLAQPLIIRRGNEVETCPINAKVSLKNQSVRCEGLVYTSTPTH